MNQSNLYQNNTELFEIILNNYSDTVKRIAINARNLIYSILPNLVEVIWLQQKTIGYGTGVKKKSEHFCWLMPAKNHVSLGFNYGAELPDFSNLLEGNGKLYRHIKLKSESQLTDENLVNLVKFATTYKVPILKNHAQKTISKKPSTN